MSDDPQFNRVPVHEQVMDWVKQEILTLKPGDKLESEAKLAKRFEVSIHTVREAITTFAHQGLLERRSGRGTIVRAPKPGKQHVALVLGIAPGYPQMGYYIHRLLESLHVFFGDQGIAPRLYWARHASTMPGGDPSLAEFKQAVARNEVGGIIAVKGSLDAQWWAALDGSGKPIVGGDRPGTKYFAAVDYRELLSEAVRFVRASGRQRLGLLGWSEGPGRGLSSLPELISCDLATCFHEAVRAHGGATQEGWIRADLWPVNPGAGYALFREMWMARPEKPDGLIISDDVLFPDIATAILEIGIRVPEDLLIVTHANKGSGTLYPFPTVRMEYDPDETANVMGGQLLRLMRQEAVEEGMVPLSCHWVGVEAVERRLRAGRSARETITK